MFDDQIFISTHGVEEALRTDAAQVASTEKEIAIFMKDNRFQYRAAINCWLALTREYTEQGCALLRQNIVARGLLDTIKCCASAADLSTHRIQVVSRESKQIALPWETMFFDGELPAWLFQLLTDIEDSKMGSNSNGLIGVYRDQLQVLRLLKRFTVVNAPVLKEKAEGAILDSLSWNRGTTIGKMSRDGYIPGRLEGHVWLINNLKSVFSDLVFWFDATQCPETLDEVVFSQGTIFETLYDDMDATRVAKIHALRRYQAYLGDEPFWYPLGTNLTDVKPLSYKVRMSSVPKNYKSFRTVGPEEILRSMRQQMTRRELERALEKSINHTPRATTWAIKRGYAWWANPKFRQMPADYAISDYGLFLPRDQELNRKACQYGSVTGEYVSVDFTSASDSNTEVLVRTLAGNELASILCRDKARIGILPNSKREVIVNMFQTMGAPTTFIVEGLVFLTVGIFATLLTNQMRDKRTKPLKPCWVFGDDCLIDSRAYTLFEEICGILGLRINQEKTYSEGWYREACGVEYLLGYELTSFYWPRRAIHKGDAESQQSLCKLQHRCFKHWRMSDYLSQLIVEEVPQMTYSKVGTDCDDLWSHFQVPVVEEDSHIVAKGKHSDYAYREVHLSLSSEVDPNFVAAKGLPLTRNTFNKLSVPQGATTKASEKPKLTKEERLQNAQKYLEKQLGLSSGDLEAFEMLRYFQFLKNGPQYATPLDQLLGVSMDPRPALGDFYPLGSRWSKTRK